MDTVIQAYSHSIAALGVLSALMLIQLLVADVLGIKNKHVPGTPVQAEHRSALFRVSRTVANTNESIAIFICALVFCLFSSADPGSTATASWAFVICRSLYAVFYYSNLQTLRSITFGMSLLALAALIVIGAMAWSG